MFFVKKLISQFLLPSGFGMLLLLAGMILLWTNRRPRAARWLLSGGFVFTFLCHYQFVSDAFLRPLENDHRALYPQERLEAAVTKAAKATTATTTGGGSPTWVVVLAGGHMPLGNLPPNDRIGEAALYRLVEGIRLTLALPGSRLLLSGGVGSAGNHGEVLAGVARALGMDQARVEVAKSGWDTEHEARVISQKLGQAPFLLVTSASHLPRAMALFRQQGANPIPAPTQHRSYSAGFDFRNLFPAPGAMQEMDTAAHEYIGMLWSRLRGRI